MALEAKDTSGSKAVEERPVQIEVDRNDDEAPMEADVDERPEEVVGAIEEAGPSANETRKVELDQAQARAFGQAVQRVHGAKAQFDQAVEAQNLALRMIGVDPEDAADWDLDTGTLTVRVGADR